MSVAGDAWLSEMWPVVREYHAYAPQPHPTRKERIPCPHCSTEYAPSYLYSHISRTHPEALDKGVENGLGGAA